ncbi:hypothetical protein C8F04DRAFT_1137345 [Mycena alexandri]|uniref:MYND-type domain-containing protein n=1 Tax=Mycena alexandri TaxID=1745969 RepID=A0AAD6S855_9AGAR|nr:hypothetical protein C8F04DRAFT_1137345 [Mycena alexandri]
MNPQLIQQAIERIGSSPKQILQKARKGSVSDLRDLANFWPQVPELVSLGILDVFFHHLDADKAFVEPSIANERSPVAECAFYALVGLTKAAEHFTPGASYHHHPSVLNSWPGVFKWSAFFFQTRVASMPPRPIEGRRTAMDVIASVWYALVQADGMRQVMAATQGSIEIATQLWLLDDEVPYSGTKYISIPAPAAALDALLVDRAAADRALAAVAGKSELIVKTAISRTRNALACSPLDPTQITIYIDLLNDFSYGRHHPLRYGLLQAGVIQLCTKGAGTLVRALNAGGSPDLLNGIISAFGYLANCLESTEGFTWVTQCLASDFLAAFADLGPHFRRLDAEDYDMICSLLTKTLPTYLVYRSVIQAVDEGMRRIKEEQFQRINSSMAKKVWVDFQVLAEERVFVVLHATAVKGKAATCDNVECHKIDAKNTFRKCGGCSTTLYCSKECQTIAWKEGGHKAMCKMKQRERLEGRSQAISKSDVAFFHHLSTRDARHHLPLLRRLARTRYPALRPCELVMRIDYTAVPPVYSVIPLAEADHHELRTNGSANAEARNDAILERAREHPDRFGLIQSTIANGAGMQMVMSVVTGNFWEGDMESAMAERMGDRTAVDDVDIMMARSTINRFLVSTGEEPTF